MEIHLVRHGRSALVHDGHWFRWAEVSAYEDAYDAAGIRDDDQPDRELRALVEGNRVIVASDLPRAIASARRLIPDRAFPVSPLLREMRLEPPSFVPIRLPIQAWDMFSHVQWTYRLLARADHELVRRASKAVDWLVEQASDSSSIVAVTHGGFRRILDAQLVARGWTRGFAKKSYANWSVWSYRT